MAMTGTISRTDRARQLQEALRLVRIYLELAKARLTALVVATTAAGYLLAGDGPVAWTTLLATLLGTALTAGGANGLNQVCEAAADARMARTRGRPVVAGCISARHASIAAAAWIAAGAFILSAFVNTPAAAMAAGAALVYVLVYTPLKQRHSICTLIGAVVGAMPPLIGAAAATGRLGLAAWTLGAVLFLWQVPHSLALAWLYREDYARGGFRLLVWVDRGWTLDMIMLYSLALLPASLTLSLAGLAGGIYATGAIVLGLGLQVVALQLFRRGEQAWARRLFLATVIYLPALLVVLLVDRGMAR